MSPSLPLNSATHRSAVGSRPSCRRVDMVVPLHGRTVPFPTHVTTSCYPETQRRRPSSSGRLVWKPAERRRSDGGVNAPADPDWQLR